jgi:hypothetical protein
LLDLAREKEIERAGAEARAGTGTRAGARAGAGKSMSKSRSRSRRSRSNIRSRRSEFIVCLIGLEICTLRHKTNVYFNLALNHGAIDDCFIMKSAVRDTTTTTTNQPYEVNRNSIFIM